MKKIDVIEDLENKAMVDDDLLLDHNQNSFRDQSNQISSNQKDIPMRSSSKLFIILTILAVISGVGTGFGSFKLFAKQSTSGSNNEANQELPSAGKVKDGDIYGNLEKEYDGFAEGYLEEGGIDGEGSHRLLRPGGESQTVALTSSETDLSELVGSEVKIWGETFKGQKAGWLMDVGRVEVLKVNGESPAEE